MEAVRRRSSRYIHASLYNGQPASLTINMTNLIHTLRFRFTRSLRHLINTAGTKKRLDFPYPLCLSTPLPGRKSKMKWKTREVEVIQVEVLHQTCLRTSKKLSKSLIAKQRSFAICSSSCRGNMADPFCAARFVKPATNERTWSQPQHKTTKVTSIDRLGGCFLGPLLLPGCV